MAFSSRNMVVPWHLQKLGNNISTSRSSLFAMLQCIYFIISLFLASCSILSPFTIDYFVLDFIEQLRWCLMFLGLLWFPIDCLNSEPVLFHTWKRFSILTFDLLLKFYPCRNLRLVRSSGNEKVSFQQASKLVSLANEWHSTFERTWKHLLVYLRIQSPACTFIEHEKALKRLLTSWRISAENINDFLPFPIQPCL